METNNQLNTANPTEPKPINYDLLSQSNATIILVLLVLQYWYPLAVLLTGYNAGTWALGLIYITWGLLIFGIGIIFYLVQTIKHWKDLNKQNKISLALFILQLIVFVAFLSYLHKLEFI